MKQERKHTDPKHIRDIIAEHQKKLNDELLDNVKIAGIEIKIKLSVRAFIFLSLLNLWHRIKSGFTICFSKKKKNKDPENINHE